MHTDRHGHTTTDRINAVHRSGTPITTQQRADAQRLLDDLLAAAARHGITLQDFDWVTNLPGICIDVVAR